MVAMTEGRCEGCHQTKVLYRDHNHETGYIRGLLCRHCNMALGYVLDNPRTLQRLARYLARPETTDLYSDWVIQRDRVKRTEYRRAKGILPWKERGPLMRERSGRKERAPTTDIEALIASGQPFRVRLRPPHWNRGRRHPL